MQGPATAPRRHQRHLDVPALKFIRMIIASYFMATALGLINGFAPGVIFAYYMSPDVAHLVGAAVVLNCSLLLFLGLFVRLASLYLAIVMLTSSIVTHFFGASEAVLTLFWQDLSLVGGLLLLYCTQSERDLRKQAVIVNKPKHFSRGDIGIVTPRRVKPTGAARQLRLDHSKVSEKLSTVGERAVALIPERSLPAIEAERFEKLAKEPQTAGDLSSPTISEGDPHENLPRPQHPSPAEAPALRLVPPPVVFSSARGEKDAAVGDAFVAA